MRSEQEIMSLLLDFAAADERVRAVSMNGSRANPASPKDKYQDYDVQFYVTDVVSFTEDRAWLDVFGTPLIIQEPDLNDNITGLFSDTVHDFTKSYGWLMLFDDGSRIDLGVVSVTEPQLFETGEEPTVALLNKDGILPAYPEPSDSAYWVKKPDEDTFHACCNEFWWCLNNVAKGIARDEMPYALEMLNHYVRDMLNKLVEWHIGIENDFSVSAGKMGKYYKKLLSPELYGRYAATYSGSKASDVWAAVDVMCDLFHDLATEVAIKLGFTYRQEEETGMRTYFRIVRK